MWIVELNKKGFSPISIGAYDNKEDAEDILILIVLGLEEIGL